MDGIVLDFGHEMTQMVPIFGGMVDIRKINTFPVGGITMDSIFMKMLRDQESFNAIKGTATTNKFTHFRTRTKFKEELSKLRSTDGRPVPGVVSANGRKFYRLPDGQFLEIDFEDQAMRPTDCYFSRSVY